MTFSALAEQARSNGLEVRIVESGQQWDVPDALSRAAYRIVQEALTNVIRHANATNVTVTLDRGPDAFSLTVRDDGQGAAEVVEGNGVHGMRERATELGGQLDVTSTGRGAGTVVTAELPWPQKVRSDT
jgi:signal transduction histidine kinase